MTDQFNFFASLTIGNPVRVDFVKESKKVAISGNLFAKDPDSGSLILFQQQNTSSDQRKCTQKFIFIPGTSIHNVQLPIGTENEERQFDGVGKDSTELKEKVERMVGLEDEAEVTNRKRTLSETVRIFDEFTLSRRSRLIDALNKYGIKYNEKPHVLVQNVQGEKVAEDIPSTVIALQSGGIKIYPPYGKNDIVGGGSIAVKELLHKLAAENVFVGCE